MKELCNIPATAVISRLSFDLWRFFSGSGIQSPPLSAVAKRRPRGRWCVPKVLSQKGDARYAESDHGIA